MQKWSRKTWIFFSTVISAGALLFLYTGYELIQHPIGSMQVFWLMMVVALLSRTYIQLPNVNGRICPTGIVTIYAALQLPPYEAILVSLAEALVASWRQSSDRTTRVLFNASAIPLSLFLGASAGHFVVDGSADPVGLDLLTQAFTVALVYFVGNMFFVLGMMIMVAGVKAVKGAKSALLWSWATYAVGGVAAGILRYLSVGEEQAVELVLLGGVIVGLTILTLKHYFEVLSQREAYLKKIQETHIASLKTLATAIEAKDPLTLGHVLRVEKLAVCIAEGFGLKGSDLESVRISAMLHDIGKLALPEYLLHPNRKLNEEDIRKREDHAKLGAAILDNGLMGDEVVQAVRHHHECFDGSGYPEGLESTDIPIAARILAVADGYDTVRHPRGRTGLSVTEACEWLQAKSGQALDPALVAVVVAGDGELLRNFESQGDDKESAIGMSLGLDSGDYVQYIDQQRANVAFSGLNAALVGNSMESGEILRVLLHSVRELVAFEVAAIYLPEGSSAKPSLSLVSLAEGYDQEDFKFDGWLSRIGAEDLATPVAVIEAASFLPVSVQENFPRTLSQISLWPISLEEAGNGYLILCHSGAEQLSGENQQNMLRLLERGSRAICNARSFDRLQRETLTDSLTSLANGRCLRRQAPFLIQESLERQSLGCLVMMDLNGFKAINDILGHDEGDRLLVEVARVLSANVRKDDLVVRNGGDEFILVLPDITPERAESLLQDIYDQACELWPPIWEHARGTSAGLAWFPSDGRSLDGLMKLADERMYVDKREKKARLASNAS